MGADHCYLLQAQRQTTKEERTPSQQFKVTIPAYAGLFCTFLDKLKIPTVCSDLKNSLKNSYFCMSIHSVLCFHLCVQTLTCQVCCSAYLPASKAQSRWDRRDMALSKAQGNTHQLHWAFSDSFLKGSAPHWARRNLKHFPYHIGTCASKSHKFGIELQTGDRTCVFPIQHSHLHPAFPIPNMNLPILWTCTQKWKTRYARYIGEVSRENKYISFSVREL